MAKKASKHRALYNKAKVLRAATAELVQDPSDHVKRAYVRGLADGLHGTQDASTALAIHMARQVIIASKE